MAATSVPFYLLTAFTSSPFAGNPAAVVIVDTEAYPSETYAKISATLSQPMTAFVSPSNLPSEEAGTIVRSVRYIVSTGYEIPICGHATLAVGKALFDMPDIAQSNLDGGFYQIRLPSTIPGTIADAEKARLKALVDKAFGRDVAVVDIKTGGETYSRYVLVELDASEDLAGSAVNAQELVPNGFSVNVFTRASTDPEEMCISRMFAPIAVPSPSEDPVCGSAHAVMAPYWHMKDNLTPGKEVKAKQVSARGGDLRVVWDSAENTVKLGGQCAVFVSGVLNVPSQ
ncbi:Diaminopimelate epimerase-like protein [Agrocybe pediades]|nr:Diaminopimelate epimerase-like protein [Agrocybe pediades]